MFRVFFLGGGVGGWGLCNNNCGLFYKRSLYGEQNDRFFKIKQDGIAFLSRSKFLTGRFFVAQA